MVKQIKKLTTLLFVAATMFTFSSCNKDDDNNPSGGGGNSTTETHGRMYGTTWTKTYKDFSVLDEGYNEDHMYIHFCTASLIFKTNSTGERHLSKDIYDEMQHETVEHFSDTVAHFTYIYNGGENPYGSGMIYWDNGDSNKFYIQGGYEGNVWLYMEGEDFPDNSSPKYSLVN